MTTTLPTTAEEYLEASRGLGFDEASRERRRELHSSLSDAEHCRVKRIQVEDAFKNCERGEVAEEELSPSGKYQIRVTPWNHQTRGHWAYTEAQVFLVGQGAPRFTVRRNYSSFYFAWIEGHPDGHDYLVCGEDYQGITMLQLDTGERVDYLPRMAFEGFGFCHALFHPSPTGTMLAVDGCYWAASYDVRVYDLSQPMVLPWPWISPDWDQSSVKRWADDTTLVLGVDEEFCLPLQKWRSEVTEAEMAKLVEELSDEAFDAAWGEDDSRDVEWTRPSNYECARTAALRVRAHQDWRETRLSRGDLILPKQVDQENIELGRALSLLTDEEKDRLVGEVFGTV